MSNEKEFELKEWIQDLPIINQELIKSTLIRLEWALDEAYKNGVEAAKREIKKFIDGRM